MKRPSLFLILLVTVIEATNNYCSLCKEHTLCKYQAEFGGKCKNRIAYGVDVANQKLVVELHNKLRAAVASGKEKRGSNGAQPPAANMKALVWDEELAKVAQRWANQCNFGHDKCRDDKRFSVGQNVFMEFRSGGSSVNSKPDWESAVNGWYNEVAKFNKNDVNKFRSNPGTGHYTQLVWAETSRVGCGFIAYGPGYKYYVCNYGPAGNYLRQSVYKKGQACSQCSQGSSCNSLGLCS